MNLSELEFEHQLKAALAAYSDGLLRSIPPDEVLEQSQRFSAKFERRMDYLMRRQQDPPRSLHHVIAKRIALIALTVALAATSLMTVEAIRIPVLRFFTEVHETFTRIVFGAESEEAPLPEEIQQVYLPVYIPEGFVLDFEMIDPSMAILSYTNGEDYFYWNQYPSDTALHVDTEGTTLEEFRLDDIIYLYYENKGVQHLIWEANGYVFTCDGTPPKETLIQIAASLK